MSLLKKIKEKRRSYRSKKISDKDIRQAQFLEDRMIIGDNHVKDVMEKSVGDFKPVKHIPHNEDGYVMPLIPLHVAEKENKKYDSNQFEIFEEFHFSEEPMFEDCGSLVEEFLTCLNQCKTEREHVMKAAKDSKLVHRFPVKDDSNSAPSPCPSNISHRSRVKEEKKQTEPVDYLEFKLLEESGSLVDEFLSCLDKHKEESHKVNVQVIEQKVESKNMLLITEYEHNKQIAELQQILDVNKNCPAREQSLDDIQSINGDIKKVDIYTLQEGVNKVRQKMESDYVQLNAELEFEKERADRLFEDLQNLEKVIENLNKSPSVGKQSLGDIESVEARNATYYNFQGGVDDLNQKLIAENLRLTAELDREKKRGNMLFQELEDLKKEFQDPQKDEVMDLKLRMKKIQQIMLKCQLDVFLSSNKNNNDKNNNNNNNSSKNKKYNKTSKVFNRLNSEREFICVRDRTD